MASGATIKPSLLFLQKYTEEESSERVHAHIDNKNYLMSVTNITDAGITSIGLPSNKNQLPEASKDIKMWINDGQKVLSNYTKFINREELTNWNIAPCFAQHISFNSNYDTAKLKDVLTKSANYFAIKNDEEYRRITIRLFNKGIVLRDRVCGKDIGTKRQNRISSGQFAISKIDGRNGAFGIIPKDLDGAIVTPDFLSYDINKQKVLPEYLELVMSNPQIQEQLDNTSSGTTGRRRLSEQVLMNIFIPLPSITEQEAMVEEIIYLKNEINSLTDKIEERKIAFTNSLFNK